MGPNCFAQLYRRVFGVKFAINLAPIKLRPNRIDVSFQRGAVSEFLHEPMIAEQVSHFVVAREPSEQILGVKFRRNFYANEANASK